MGLCGGKERAIPWKLVHWNKIINCGGRVPKSRLPVLVPWQSTALVMSKTLQVNGEFLQNRQGVVYLIGSQGKSKASTAYLFSKYTKNDFWIGSA